jgi:hypothetical protein
MRAFAKLQLQLQVAVLLSAPAGALTGQQPLCAAAAFRRACLPCRSGSGTGDCRVIKKVQLDAELNATVLAAQCCAQAQNYPQASVWTLNERNSQCILKVQGTNYPKWNDTDDPCTSGRGPAPLPSPSPSPSPSPPASPCPPRPLSPPLASRNLLYIVVDDLRNELGFTNARKGLMTPNIDALAKKGMVFSRAYIQQGVCSPSRNSFLSGRRPDTTRIWNFQDSFRTFLGDCVTSWPGAFKNAGFISTGMGKVYHVRTDLSLKQLRAAPASF